MSQLQQTEIGPMEVMVVLDSMPKSIRDAINYSKIGISRVDIAKYYLLHYTKKKTTFEILRMIKQKEMYEEMTAIWAKK